MRRFKTPFTATQIMRHATSMLLSASMVFLASGCRNTPAPVSPLGGGAALSPLAPVQGTAILSPVQPASGISTLGAPTRVPPPATGSYRSPNNYATGAALDSTSSTFVPGGFSPGALMPSGAVVSSNGMTRGVTDLSGIAGSGVRQTGWIADPAGSVASGGGFATAGYNQSNPAAMPESPVRQVSGGMPVIDLTTSAYPPGYVPPSHRPGVGAPAVQPISSNWTGASALQQAPQPGIANSAPLGQPVNSTFDRTASGFAGFSDQNSNQLRTASQPAASSLPSTAPFPASPATAGQTDPGTLQWRRASPQF